MKSVGLKSIYFLIGHLIRSLTFQTAYLNKQILITEIFGYLIGLYVTCPYYLLHKKNLNNFNLPTRHI